MSKGRIAVAAVAVLVAACGSDDGAQGTPDAPVAPDAPPAALTVTASPSRVVLARGDTVDIAVTVTRANTVGPVFVGASSLPSGVSMSPIALPDGVETGRVTMTAGESAALASTDVQLVAAAGATVATVAVSIVVSNRNGLLDRTFASTGYVTTTLGATDAALFDVAIQPDGGMLVAGSIGVTPARNVVIARFHPDGTLDSTFGTAGVTTWDLGADDVATGVAVLPDGRSVVTAYSLSGGGTSVTSAARLLSATGFAVSSDASFGAQGTIASATNEVASPPVAHAAGVSWAFSGRYYRYAPAEAAPLLTASNPVNAHVLAAPDPTTVFSAGTAQDPELCVGLSTDAFGLGYGQVTSFGTNGVSTVGSTSGQFATALVTRANGHVVMSRRTAPSSTDFTLSAVQASNGAIATSFGAGGHVAIDFAQGPDYAEALIGTTAGMIIGGAATLAGSGSDLALARIYDSGDLDTDFGIAGRVTTDIAGGDDAIFDIAFDSGGRVIAVGYATVQGHLVAVIARYSVAP